MNAMRRGWCPSLYEPMATGDGLLVRVKPPGARLSSAAARAVAAAARGYGNGIIELTSRGNLQVRGLRADGVAGFAAAMVAAGLADADPAIERRRIVIPPPLAGDDPAVASDAGTLAAALDALFATGPAFADLPGKFSVAIDGGGVLAGRHAAADIVVRSDGAQHWIAPGGLCGAPADTVGIVARLARAMHQAPAVAGQGPAPVGLHPYAGTAVAAFGLGVPFGQADAAMLEALADLADRFSGGMLRTSPFRAVFLGRVRPDDAPAIAAAAGRAGLATDPADPRLRISACIGSPGCARATVPARADAARLAALGIGGTLHVSGCAKGCAHPGPAALTLVGDAGRYGLVRNGRASDPPALVLGDAADAMHYVAG